jgi:hypothetical protein
MKLLFMFLFLMSFSQSTFGALPIELCGEYKAKGVIEKNREETGYSLIINKNTKSEYKFKIKLQDELEVSSFLSKNILMSFIINHSTSGMKGEVDKVISIKKIPSEGFEVSKKNEIELIKKSECIK